MTFSRSRRLGATLMGAILAAGSFTTAGAQSSPSPGPGAKSRSELAAIAKARADSARYPYTGADIHFMSGMIAHHAQAIVMDRKSTRLNSSHVSESRMPPSA